LHHAKASHGWLRAVRVQPCARSPGGRDSTSNLNGAAHFAAWRSCQMAMPGRLLRPCSRSRIRPPGRQTRRNFAQRLDGSGNVHVPRVDTTVSNEPSRESETLGVHDSRLPCAPVARPHKHAGAEIDGCDIETSRGSEPDSIQNRRLLRAPAQQMTSAGANAGGGIPPPPVPRWRDRTTAMRGPTSSEDPATNP